jgi:hypothetical protein
MVRYIIGSANGRLIGFPFRCTPSHRSKRVSAERLGHVCESRHRLRYPCPGRTGPNPNQWQTGNAKDIVRAFENLPLLQQTLYLELHGHACDAFKRAAECEMEQKWQDIPELHRISLHTWFPFRLLLKRTIALERYIYTVVARSKFRINHARRRSTVPFSRHHMRNGPFASSRIGGDRYNVYSKEEDVLACD